MKLARYAVTFAAVFTLVMIMTGGASAESMAVTDNGLYMGLDQATAFIATTTDNPASEEARLTFSLTCGLNGADLPTGDLTAISFEFTYDPDRLTFVEATAVGAWTLDTTLIEPGRIKVDIYGSSIVPPDDDPTAFAELLFHVKCQPENTDNTVALDRLRGTATIGTIPYEPPASGDNWQDGTVTVADYIVEFRIADVDLTAGYGEEVSVPVTGTSNFKLLALSHQITYDDTKLEFLGVTLDGIDWQGYFAPGEPQPGDNPIVVPLVAHTYYGTDPLNEDVVYTLRFRVKSDVQWDGQSTSIQFDSENSTVWVHDGTSYVCEAALADDPPVFYVSGSVGLERYTAQFKAVPIANNICTGCDNTFSYVLQMKNRFFAGMPEDSPDYYGNVAFNLDVLDGVDYDDRIDIDDSIYFRVSHDDKSLGGTMMSVYQYWDPSLENYWGVQDEFKDAIELDFTYNGSLPSSYAGRFITPFNFAHENPFVTYGNPSRVTDLNGVIEADSTNGRLTWDVEPMEIEMGEFYGGGGWSKYGNVVSAAVKMRHNVDLSDFQIDAVAPENYIISGIGLGDGVSVELVPGGFNRRRLVPALGAEFPATGTAYRTLATISYRPASGCTSGTRVVGTVVYTNRIMIDTDGHYLHTVGNNSASLSAICGTPIDPPMDTLPVIPADRKPDAGLPDVFALHANYPNPFNPSTSIQFDLPSPCHVTLDIFNIAGQKVATVADRAYEAGFHTVEWDGRTSGGQQVASGIYLYRIAAGDFVETRKMMLLK